MAQNCRANPFDALGLHPDGKPDRVVEIKFQPTTGSPMALFSLRNDTPTYTRVERRDPVGAYDTGCRNK